MSGSSTRFYGMQHDESAAVADTVADAHGWLPAKRLRRKSQQHKQRLQKLVLQHWDDLKITVQLLDEAGFAAPGRLEDHSAVAG